MAQFRFDHLLMLSRSVHGVPVDAPDAAALMLPAGPPMQLRIPGHDVLDILQALQLGITYGDLTDTYFKADHRAAGALLDQLSAEGLLLRPLAPEERPAPEIAERFDRLIAYFGEHEAAGATRVEHIDRLRTAHVVLLGLGSMASWIIGHLAANGVGRLSGVDPDRVEASNLSRQALYSDGDIGRRKTEAAEVAIGRQSRLTTFTGVAQSFGSADDIKRILGELPAADVVVLTADQPLWRVTTWASRACAELGVPLLRVNVSGVGPFWTGPGTACPSCELARLDRGDSGARLLDYRASDRYRSAANSATISTAIAVQGTVASHEVIGYLTGAWTPASVNRRLQVSLGPSFAATTREVEQVAACPGCGAGDGR